VSVVPEATAPEDETELRLPLRGDVGSVAEARRAVAAFASHRIRRDRRYELALAVSEVVTNALRHGAPDAPIDLLARASNLHLRVEVTDSGSGLAPRPRALESDGGGGFGLFLVEQLARRWGVVRQTNTTRVWFEFDFD
jgi:anti-sigma regulatory factor (Ser/Thr protein kinase)